ncbi:CDP-alcohol phosphatidyltransferase family protein [Calothrix sp. UHCC 0171]|uniref:CDP-alcohol phosphatidyltransferase family protein n=1 Tax=Calothrix sp. UHCC 0171 TaxID=3110245 RepID=UPI002B1FB58A|nr:CDP-alcohol phosphatidyltransferase family protein [Calothrix sp. UHCC 0171]MEA5571742.1 CDP-alcohol phosphatidyltransferase family protein [Calothrix sp. UHCC 0171]
MAVKTWDAKIANWLVQPLKNTWVTPNHLTTVRLITGLAAAFILGIEPKLANIGAFVFALSNFLDHTDGELARISGKSSKLGHVYDLASDAIIHILIFLGIGIGLRNTQLGYGAILMGLVSGIAVAFIFHWRNQMEKKLGKDLTSQPNFCGFDIEDILYLLPIVTILNGLIPLLIAATIGAPVFAIWVFWEYQKVKYLDIK